MMKGNFVRGGIYKIPLFFVLITLTVLLLAPLQDTLDEYMKALKMRTIEGLEERLGREIHYQKISPSILLSLDLHRLRISDSEGVPISYDNLRVEKLRIFYSFFDLLDGKTVDAIREIEINNARIVLDEERDQELIELFTQGKGKTPAEEASPPDALHSPKRSRPLLPRITLRGENISLFFSNGENDFEITQFFFRYEGGEGQEKLKSLSARGKLNGDMREIPAAEQLPLSSFQSDFSVNGELSRDLSRLSSTLTFRNFTSDLISFSRLNVGLTHNRSKTVVRKIEDRSPWNLRMRYSAEKQLVSLFFSSDDFALSDNITFEKELAKHKQWFSTRLTGEAEVDYRLDTEKLSYSADLRAAVSHRSLPEAFTADFQLQGNKKRIVVKKLDMQSKSTDASYRGTVDLKTFLPEGRLRVDRLEAEGHRFRGTFNVSHENESISLESDALLIDSSIRLTPISLRANLSDIQENRVDFRSYFSFGPTRLPVDEDSNQSDIDSPLLDVDNSVHIDGSVSISSQTSVEMFFKVRSAPVYPVLADFAPQLVEESVPTHHLLVSTEGFFSGNLSDYRFSLHPFEMRDLASDFNLYSRVTGSKTGIELQGLTASYDGYSASGGGNVSFDSGKTIDFETTLRVNEKEYSLDGTYHNRSLLILRGNYGLNAHAFFHGDRIAFSATAENFPIPLKERTSSISFKGRGRVDNESGWAFQLSSFSMNDPPGLIADSSFSLSAAANPKRIKVWNIRYRDSTSSLKGEGWFSPSSLSPPAGNGWLELSPAAKSRELMRGENGEKDSQGAERNDIQNKELKEETYRVVFSLSEEEVESTVSVKSAPLSRWKILPVDGLFSGTFRINGPKKNPSVDFTAEIENGTYRASPFEVEMRGTSNTKQLSLTYLRGNYGPHIFQKGEVEYRAEEGTLRIKGEYRGTISKKTARSNFDIEADLAAKDSLFSFPEIVQEDYSARATLSDIQIFGKSRTPWEVEMQKLEKKILFEGGPEDAVSGSFTTDGEYSVEVGKPFPLRFTSEGNFDEGEISAKVENLIFELEAAEELGFTTVLFSSGVLEGSMSIEGKVSDPDFRGTLRARNVSGDVDYLTEKVKPFSTTVEFEEKECVVSPVEVNAGKGKAVLSGGFTFDRWTPTDIRVNASTLGENGLPFLLKLEYTGLSIEGYGRGDISILTTGKETKLSGDASIRECTIALEEREEPPSETSASNTLIVDMDIETGPQVEFLWPRKRLPIISAYAKTGQKISISYNSFENSFTLKGEVSIQGGEIFYFQRSFFLKEGKITFNETEDSFNPLLQARAEIREIDMSGHPVTIRLIIDNEPLNSFTPRFESSPPMSTIEIAQLLGMHLTGTVGEDPFNLTSALMFTGGLFSQFSIVSSFEEQMKEVLNLDLFSLRTQLVQNLLIERVEGQNAQLEQTETLNEPDPLGRYLDNTTLFLGKYLGSDFFLEAMLQIRNRPSYLGEIQGNDLNFSMEVGLEWKTPIFLLNISINPDFTEPRKSLGNTKIGLSWDYSY